VKDLCNDGEGAGGGREQLTAYDHSNPGVKAFRRHPISGSQESTDLTRNSTRTPLGGVHLQGRSPDCAEANDSRGIH